MSVTVAVVVFLAGLIVSVASSVVLAERVDQVGTWLGLSEGLLGVLTALGADSPEIASAVTAIVGGNHDLGLGVVFGSNIFNLAGLLGLSAVTAGCVRVGRAGLWFDGGAGLAVLAVVAVRLMGWVGNGAAVAGVLAILIPYLAISAMKPAGVDGLPLPAGVRAVLHLILGQTQKEKRTGETPSLPSRTDLLGVVPALVAVVVASVGMVRSAEVLGPAWGVPHAVVGLLILSALTGVPNVLAAVRLASRGRGTAVVSETLNSNTVNLIVGALVPAVLFGTGPLDHRAVVAVAWLGGMTVLSLALASRRAGLTRVNGVVLLAVYAGFVAVVLGWG